MNLILITSLLLGLLAFFEPCSIATHTLFSARNHSLSAPQRLLSLGLFLLARLGLLLGIALFADGLLPRLDWQATEIAAGLTAVAALYLLSRIRYLPIPNINLTRLLPFARRVPTALQIGLSLPACTLPLFAIVFLAAHHQNNLVVVLLSTSLFGLASALPVLVLSLRGLSEETRALLKDAGQSTPLITALLLLLSAATMMASEHGINISQLKQVLQTPTLWGLGLGFMSGFIFSFNPVAIASIPVVLAYVTRAHEARRALFYGGAFVLAMLLTHALLGVASALGGQWVEAVLGRWWGLFLGPLLMLLGLIWLGWVRFRLPWFAMRGRKVTGVWGAFLLGIPFSVAICPFCTPALLVMLAASAAIGSPGFGLALLFAFALGRSIPIILGAISISWLESMGGLSQQQRYFEWLGGMVLILTGLYMLNEYFFIVPL